MRLKPIEMNEAIEKSAERTVYMLIPVTGSTRIYDMRNARGFVVDESIPVPEGNPDQKDNPELQQASGNFGGGVTNRGIQKTKGSRRWTKGEA